MYTQGLSEYGTALPSLLPDAGTIVHERERRLLFQALWKFGLESYAYQPS